MDKTALTLPAFGEMEPERVLAMDDLFAVVSDTFPVSPGHALVIPRRALTRFQELNATERVRLLEWVDWAQEHLSGGDGRSTGGRSRVRR